MVVRGEDHGLGISSGDEQRVKSKAVPILKCRSFQFYAVQFQACYAQLLEHTRQEFLRARQSMLRGEQQIYSQNSHRFLLLHVARVLQIDVENYVIWWPPRLLQETQPDPAVAIIGPEKIPCRNRVDERKELRGRPS